MLFLRVNIGARLQQQAHRVRMTSPRRLVQRRLAVLSLRVDVGTRLQQFANPVR